MSSKALHCMGGQTLHRGESTRQQAAPFLDKRRPCPPRTQTSPGELRRLSSYAAPSSAFFFPLPFLLLPLPLLLEAGSTSRSLLLDSRARFLPLPLPLAAASLLDPLAPALRALVARGCRQTTTTQG